MLRICPKCGDYYADALLAFCLVDGAPLINVDPTSERWSEGARVIEEKENALRRQKRKLKWRRIVVSAMTMAIATLVVYVVAANTLIYLKPKPNEVALAAPSTPESAPAAPVASITPNTPGETSPTLPTNSTTTKTPTPTPTPVYKISGRVTDGSKALGGVNLTLGGAKTATTTTDASGNYIFKQLLAGGSYTITPAGAKINFTPPRRSINKLTQDQSAYFVGTVQAECSQADEGPLIKSCGAIWRRKIADDGTKIIKEYFPNLVGIAVPHLSEKITYQIRFSNACKEGVATASYTWQVTAPLIKTVPLPKEKKLSFKKPGETWVCN
jgi:hypothetical protein